MTFKEIQDAVLLDRFNETQRSAVKFAINSRYGRLWAIEPWSFKRAQITFVVPAGSNYISMEDLGLQTVEAVHQVVSGASHYTRLDSLYPDEFVQERDLRISDKAVSFTIHSGGLRVDATNTADLTYLALGQLKWVPLVDDTDVPLIPEEYHYALVQGGAADMLLRESDPTWQGEEKGFTDQVNEMRLGYLNNLPMKRRAYPSWP